MAETQDVNTLKRRGRRRLVGAIALVLLAVIVLPMVFDSEPRQSAPPVSVRIPSEEDGGFSPKVTPKAPPPPESVRAEPAKAEPAETEAPAPQQKAQPAKPPAVATSEQFVVQVGAFADPAGVLEKLKSVKLPYYTEPLATAKGTVTRVRVGPFASRESAERAQQQLKKLGFKPGNVAAKS